jgi:hypothetical protein
MSEPARRAADRVAAHKAVEEQRDLLAVPDELALNRWQRVVVSVDAL